MTDLATRIADVKQKAEAATPGPWVGGITTGWNFPGQVSQGTPENRIRRIAMTEEEDQRANGAYIAAASPDLILAMAARIEELEKALEPFARAASLYRPETEDCVIADDNEAFDVGHLRTAALILKLESN
jgi:hypothetical protein